jgi:hypothetical protein
MADTREVLSERDPAWSRHRSSIDEVDVTAMHHPATIPARPPGHISSPPALGTVSSRAGTSHDRAIGRWSARALFVLTVVYSADFVVGFAALGNLQDPLPDPYLAVGEVLILVMAPVMVALMLAVHACAAPRARSFTQVALGWMLAAAALTTTVHFVELSVARHIDPASFPGYPRIFDFQWPSLLYAVDIVAWDAFFGLALLFAVPAFWRRSDTAVRIGLAASGSLCLLGLIGPLTGAIAWRAVGIFGYTLVFAATCVPLARAFRSDADDDAVAPGRRVAGARP